MSKVIIFPLGKARPDIKKGKGRVNYLRGLVKALGDDKKAWEILNGKRS